ncbi:glycine betaine ABC transporter substrate-binding protein [Sinobaca sp. H24]|uniref:glycine betaine ABC transporter substrate-binding protein n=1 Tax=Sinobaca sp. H24 TaxID=2923376 RepID=UPI00207A0609|nr:glycine betaine ABC transporter substrate-binding protein [Sinobaca sp. H24]
MNSIWKKTAGLSIAGGLTIGLAACGGGSEESEGAEEEGGEVNLTYVAWESEIASSNVIKLMLEEAGQDVTLTQVDQSPMWSSVANGDADGFVAAWLPTDMDAEYERYGDEMVDLGPNLEGNKTGLAVPEYMDIDSIEDITTDTAEHITGIDAGAGIMLATEEALDVYDLDIELLASTDAAMTSELGGKINNEEPVIVTAWQPHWKFNTYDLKFLEDPEGVFEADGEIRTMVREGLAEDNPEAYQILDNFYWTPEDMNQVMLDVAQNDMEPEEASQKWIDENRDTVDEWLETEE